MLKKKKPPPIGQQIAVARKAAGMTQAQFGELAGLPQSNVSRIERGVFRPSIPTLSRIAGVLDLSLLIDGDGARLVEPP